MAETDKRDSALDDITTHIAKAAAIAERSASDIELVAISKTRSASEIRVLLERGHRVFGENRVQEAAAKWPELRADYPDVSLHLVGQLQSNKADDAVALFDVIHSLDRMSLVRALGKAMQKQDRDIPCFVQVNIGEESQKGGCAIAETGDLIAAARDAGIPICGLMCVPPSGVNAAPYFALLAKLAADHELSGLSMGMSGDFETAIKLGATHIRVGTALFGPRDATA
ncbi:hypothetical protein SAMN02745824_0592 [Parasphingorhabdus marina DSM 22363]|uniref:Pyridoxal phosphate homeostasis protein n=2 Tax=Parasphingorhabdus marina TaxID=394732 RepID=A0A1N6CNN3_9SPHN|nr:hypothetical protein SAMN02745824_0592 [Parasphingorhabdus marina DSM 22363]